MTANRAIILSGVFANLIAVLVAFTVREIKVDSSDDNDNNDRGGGDDGGGNHSNYKTLEVDACDDDADDCVDDGNDDGGGLDDGRNVRSSSRSVPNNIGVSKFKPTGGSSLQILSETLRTPNFRRFLVVCLLTINVRMVFRHL
jgi:hypothetical protein